jgi:hypothetical protein
MTTGPTDVKVTTAAGGPDGMPLALKLNEGLGVSVGSNVWLFDENRRKYRERKPGELYAGGGPIWREHWAPRQIVGETSRSWILNGPRCEKIPKKGVNLSVVAFSEADIDRRAWVNDNKYLIERAVGRINDFELLQRVAAMVGFETPNV